MLVTEAQEWGSAVLATSTTSFPEAAGDAAVLVDPKDVDAIAAGLRRLLEDEELRLELSDRGQEHARSFTWASTARKTAEVYRDAGT